MALLDQGPLPTTLFPHLSLSCLLLYWSMYADTLSVFSYNVILVKKTNLDILIKYKKYMNTYNMTRPSNAIGLNGAVEMVECSTCSFDVGWFFQTFLCPCRFHRGA